MELTPYQHFLSNYNISKSNSMLLKMPQDILLSIFDNLTGYDIIKWMRIPGMAEITKYYRMVKYVTIWLRNAIDFMNFAKLIDDIPKCIMFIITVEQVYNTAICCDRVTTLSLRGVNLTCYYTSITEFINAFSNVTYVLLYKCTITHEMCLYLLGRDYVSIEQCKILRSDVIIPSNFSTKYLYIRNIGIKLFLHAFQQAEVIDIRGIGAIEYTNDFKLPTCKKLYFGESVARHYQQLFTAMQNLEYLCYEGPMVVNMYDSCNHTTLKELVIDNDKTRGYDVDIQYIKKFVNLESLEIKTRLIDNIQMLEDFNRLTSLKVHSNDWLDPTTPIIHITTPLGANMPHLTELHLCGNLEINLDLLAGCSALETLVLSVKTHSIEPLAHLPKLQNLRLVKWSYCLTELNEAVALKSLTIDNATVVVNHNKLFDCQTLKKFSIINCNIGNLPYGYFSGYIEEFYVIQRCFDSESTSIHCSVIDSMFPLTSVNLTNIFNYMQLGWLPALTKLHLEYYGGSTEALRYIAAQYRNISDLYLGGFDCSSIGPIICTMSKLKRLDIWGGLMINLNAVEQSKSLEAVVVGNSRQCIDLSKSDVVWRFHKAGISLTLTGTLPYKTEYY